MDVSLNNRINRLHERSLRIVYNDYTSTFEELLMKDNSLSIHHRNLQVFATLLYKIINNQSPELLTNIFPVSCGNQYNLRSANVFQARNVYTVRYGTETLSFLARTCS